MKPIKGPRAGSRAHSVLTCLQARGGEANHSVLARVVAWMGSPLAFNEGVIGPLVREGFVSTRNGVVVLSKQGVLFLNPPAPVDPSSVVLVRGGYVAPQRPLSAQNRSRLSSMRPGALDYRDIPSRLSGQLLPHGEKAVA